MLAGIDLAVALYVFVHVCARVFVCCGVVLQP